MAAHKRNCPKRQDRNHTCTCSPYYTPLNEQEEDAAIEYLYRVQALDEVFPYLEKAMNLPKHIGVPYAFECISSLGIAPEYIKNVNAKGMASWLLDKMSAVQSWLYHNQKKRGLFEVGEVEEEQLPKQQEDKKERLPICLLLSHVGTFDQYRIVAAEERWELLTCENGIGRPRARKIDLVIKVTKGFSHAMQQQYRALKLEGVPQIEIYKVSAANIRKILQATPRP